MKKYSFIPVLLIISTFLIVFMYSCSNDASDLIAKEASGKTAAAANPGLSLAVAAATNYVGQTITIKGSNNKFVSGENGTKAMLCDRTTAQDWEKFTVVDAGGGKVALKSMGKYVSSENGSGTINCSRTSIQDWEKFTLVQNSNGTVSFKGSNGKYISSENGTAGMTCNRSSIGGWEQFTLSGSGGGTQPPATGWQRANLTHYTSYPDPGSEECIKYNGCTWAGYFAFLDGKQPESWVQANNIVAMYPNGSAYAHKTLEIRKNGVTIRAKVYDTCADSDCSGCCTQNANQNGIGVLIDMEKYTMQRFGQGDGIVEWRCVDCN